MEKSLSGMDASMIKNSLSASDKTVKSLKITI